MLKRDNWTNEEVIDILAVLKSVNKEGKDINDDFNTSLDVAISQFWDFIRHTDEFGAMAYDTDNKEILVVGAKLPR